LAAAKTAQLYGHNESLESPAGHLRVLGVDPILSYPILSNPIPPYPAAAPAHIY